MSTRAEQYYDSSLRAYHLLVLFEYTVSFAIPRV